MKQSLSPDWEMTGQSAEETAVRTCNCCSCLRTDALFAARPEKGIIRQLYDRFLVMAGAVLDNVLPQVNPFIPAVPYSGRITGFVSLF